MDKEVFYTRAYESRKLAMSLIIRAFLKDNLENENIETPFQ